MPSDMQSKVPSNVPSGSVATKPAATSVASNALREDAAVIQLMEPIEAILKDWPGATEFSMCRPGEAFVKCEGKLNRIEVPEFTMARLQQLANGVGIYAKQDISERHPLLSATLPRGRRIQFVITPAVEPGRFSMSIRIPGREIRTMQSYVDAGAFDRFVWTEDPVIAQRFTELSVVDQQLVEMLRSRKLMEFLIAAVRAKKNMAMVGDTGSGKTTLMKALCQHIPFHEVIATIEDVRELYLPNHSLHHPLLYSKGSQGVAKVTPADLLGCVLRLDPDRALVAELRGAEAFDLLNMLTSGHRGVVTSYHSESTDLAPQRYAFMCRENPNASTFSNEEFKALVALTIDVFVHVAADPVLNDAGDVVALDRYVTQVSFNPASKLVDTKVAASSVATAAAESSHG